MNEHCREIEAVLSPYLDGELDIAERRRVEAHLAECAACRAVLQEWRRTDAALRASPATRSDVEWERLAQRVEAAIDAEDEKARAAAAATVATSPVRPSLRRWWLWSGSGALVAAALVVLFWPWIVPRPNESPVMRTNGGGGPPPSGLESRSKRAAPESVPTLSATEPPAASSEPTAPTEEPAARVARPSTLAETTVPPAGTAVDVRRVALANPPEVGQALRHDAEPAAPTVASEDTPPPASDVRAGVPASGKAAPSTPESVAPTAPSPASKEATSSLSWESPPGPEPSKSGEGFHAERTIEPGRGGAEWRTFGAESGTLAPEMPRDRSADARQLSRPTDGSAFAVMGARVDAALVAGDERALFEAASAVDAFLGQWPQSPHRVDGLAARLLLRARLAVLDPERCAEARVAADEWRRAASEPTLEDLQAAARQVDELCGK